MKGRHRVVRHDEDRLVRHDEDRVVRHDEDRVVRHDEDRVVRHDEVQFWFLVTHENLGILINSFSKGKHHL